MLNQIGVIPFGIFPARRCGEVGTESEHFPQLFLRGFPLAELAECRSPGGVRVEEIGHVYANRQLKRLRVLTLAIGRGEQGKAEQARIVGIELHGSFHHLTTPLKLAGVVDEHPEDAHDRSVHGIQCEGLLRLCPERNHLFAGEVNEGQRIVAEGKGRPQIHSPLGGCQSAIERIGPGIESVYELDRVHQGQHGPAIGVVRSLAHGGVLIAQCLGCDCESAGQPNRTLVGRQGVH